MTWILTIAGTLLSLFFGIHQTDRLYEGIFYGVALSFCCWLGVTILNRIQIQAWQVLLAGLGGLLLYNNPQVLPSIPSLPSVPAVPTRPRLLPWKQTGDNVDAFVEGDGYGPGGVEVVCDLPMSMRMHNTGGMGPRGPGTGAGLCVFTSIEHAAKWQDEHRLFGLQKKMTHEPGGGSPPKVDAMIAKYGAGTEYVQHTGGDEDFLLLALKTGRMPGVTYAGRDIRYNGPIAHMVNLVYLDDKTAAILDNNYQDKILWMTRKEFLERWRDRGGGWAVVLLSSPPPPVPHN